MIRITAKSIRNLTLLVVATAATASGALTLDWWTIDSGGAMATTGGRLELSGTIGQYDAGGPLTGGRLSLVGGFWPGAQPGASDQYRLTVRVEGQGSVVLDPPGGMYDPGTVVQLTAVADAGWSFDHWEGALSGSTNPEFVRMDRDLTVTAVFTEDQYRLTVLIDGRGSVDLDPPGGTYASGTTVQLTAVADAGWSFDHWEGALSGSANPERLVMDRDLTVTAVFTQDMYRLTVLIDGRGRVDLDPPGGTYASGTTVQLTAVADAGWSFDHWEGALSGSRNPETLVMDGDLTVTAVFTQDQYTLTVFVTGQGRVDLDPPGGTYAPGTAVQLTAVADEGWLFDHWEGALTGSRNPESLVMDDDLTVTAVFIEEQPCFGDLDGDGEVGLSDLAQLLSNYGETSGMTYWDGDLDEDGDVDLSDLAALLSVYGTICP